MNEEKKTLDEQVALFRYGLIADLVHADGGDNRTLHERLREKEHKAYCIPGSTRTRVAAETMRDWLAAYREGGFDALKPRPRKDTGAIRHIPCEVADLLITLKEDNPGLSVSLVIDAAKAQSELASTTELPISTVHRILARAGVMQKSSETPTSKDRRHFEYEHANELWMSDVMHGPKVGVAGKRRGKTYLHGLIDDATRVEPYGAFALAENTSAFLPIFQQSVQRRGIPKRLYVDNGSLFRSHHLGVVCAKLGTTLIHARPYQPSGKGKIERFFRTVRLRFLPTVHDSDLASLDALNRRYWAWVESDYHRRAHKGLDGISPLDAWAMRATEVRVPGPEVDLREMFLFEQKRKVARDRIVRLGGNHFEVDAALVGEKVTLRFDPTKPKGPVDVWHQGKKVQVARIVDPRGNCHVKRNHGGPPAPTGPAPLSMHTLGDSVADKEVR